MALSQEEALLLGGIAKGVDAVQENIVLVRKDIEKIGEGCLREDCRISAIEQGTAFTSGNKAAWLVVRGFLCALLTFATSFVMWWMAIRIKNP